MSDDTYGWYYEEESADAGYLTPWDAIEEACEDMLAHERSPVRVGPMRAIGVRDFLTVEDVRNMRLDGQFTSTRDIFDHLDARICDEVGGDYAVLEMSADRRADLDRMIVALHDGGDDTLIRCIVDFAAEHIGLPWDSVCDGVDPFPIVYVDGEWKYGVDPDEYDANIGFIADGDEGENGFWWALSPGEGVFAFGPRGIATLKEAMSQAEAAVIKVRKEKAG